jgi:hypothetical protein
MRSYKEILSFLLIREQVSSVYAGAAFYVPAEQVELCCQILQEAGLSAGLMEKQGQ